MDRVFGISASGSADQWIRILERNSWARSVGGAAKKVSGIGGLDDPPVGHEHDPVRRLAGEAHLVGDHDHRHARRAARPSITSSTSLIISGSSAEVGSSNSITFGSIASARAIATRCC